MILKASAYKNDTHLKKKKDTYFETLDKQF